jgi:hypothetical protein
VIGSWFGKLQRFNVVEEQSAVKMAGFTGLSSFRVISFSHRQKFTLSILPWIQHLKRNQLPFLCFPRSISTVTKIPTSQSPPSVACKWSLQSSGVAFARPHKASSPLPFNEKAVCGPPLKTPRHSVPRPIMWLLVTFELKTREKIKN